MGTKKINLVVVTGMSGAGKTVAIQSFEDIGYFTIDNMPPSLVPKVIELVKHSEETDKIALVVDMRSRLFFDEINDILDKLESNEELNFKILFLDATDGELVSRYKETRRSHPLAADGRVLDGIKLERELLSPLKSLSQNVVDTTELTPRQLRKAISEQFSSEQDQSDLLTIQKLQTEMIMGVSQQVEKMSDDIRALKEERLERESHGNEKN